MIALRVSLIVPTENRFFLTFLGIFDAGYGLTSGESRDHCTKIFDCKAMDKPAEQNTGPIKQGRIAGSRLPVPRLDLDFQG